jgi:hypothetical protein
MAATGHPAVVQRIAELPWMEISGEFGARFGQKLNSMSYLLNALVY